MNTFVAIERLEELCGSKVNFYSVRFENSKVSEFYDFLNRHENIKEVEDDLNHLIEWLDRIAATYGAQKHFFRHEGITSDTSALPPPRKYMKLNKLEVEHLRLYCLRANVSVVFLFNGGMKTTGTDNAKDCPNVGPYIKQANEFTKKLNELFQQGIIGFNDDQSDIIIHEDGIFEL